MSEIFVTLEEAAVFEGVVYETMKKRIQRNPGGFRVKSQPREGGGKDQVMVAVSSLTPKAKRAHKAAQKIDGGDAIIEQRVNTTPWYVDVDLNWYIETHKKQYYEAVELAKQVQQFVEHDEAERTAYADETALKLGVSQRTLYRYAEGLLEANAWALKMEKEEGKNTNISVPSPFAGSRGIRTHSHLSPMNHGHSLKIYGSTSVLPVTSGRSKCFTRNSRRSPVKGNGRVVLPIPRSPGMSLTS